MPKIVRRNIRRLGSEISEGASFPNPCPCRTRISLHEFSNAPEQIKTEQNKQTAHDWVNPVSEPTAIEALQHAARRRPYQHDRQAVADAIEKQQHPAIDEALLVYRKGKNGHQYRCAARPDDERKQQSGSKSAANPRTKSFGVMSGRRIQPNRYTPMTIGRKAIAYLNGVAITATRPI